MFPQVVPKFFKSRHEGRKNLGKDPAKKTPDSKAAAGAAGATSALSAKVSYVITLDGKEHKVSVAPSNVASAK
jgi:methylmalonyl-CoA carboxyltransferase 5S subunit